MFMKTNNTKHLLQITFSLLVQLRKKNGDSLHPQLGKAINCEYTQNIE